MIESSTSLLFKLLFFPLSTLLDIIPVNKNIWVFGTGLGENYNDNSKYLFEYVINNNGGKSKIRPIWLTKNKTILETLKKEGKEVYLFHSVKGLFYSLVSGVVIVSFSWIDLPLTSFILRKKKVVQLWHGTPFRKVDFKSGSLFEKLLKVIFLSYLGREFDLVLVATPKVIEIHRLKNVSNIDEEKIKVTGSPRTDILHKNYGHFAFLKQGKTEKVFLYLPTWRHYRHNLFDAKYGFNFARINNFLHKNRSYLVVKVHPEEFKKYKKLNRLNNSRSRIIFTFVEDIYPFMKSVDCLLTDYSSVYFDFLILDKPIIFLPFDMEEYVKDNHGFYYDYDWVTAGPKTQNWIETLTEMKKIILGKDKYKKQRRIIDKLFNTYSDGNNSKRVFNEICNVE